MSFRRPVLIAIVFMTAILLWLQGCAQEAAEPTGLISRRSFRYDHFRLHAGRGDNPRPLGGAVVSCRSSVVSDLPKETRASKRGDSSFTVCP